MLSRRQFVALSTASVAGALISPNLARSWPGGGETATDELPFRHIHLDFHTSEAITGIGRYFDPDRFAETLTSAYVNSITCFARGHHGWIYFDTGRFPERRHPHLFGLGEKKDASGNVFEKAAAGVVKHLLNSGAKTVSFHLDAQADHESAARTALGASLAAYRFDQYRTKLKADKKPSLKTAEIVVSDEKAAKRTWKEWESVSEGVATARDLVMEPANVLHPEEYAKRVKKLMEKLDVEVEILGEKEMEKLGMGALLGVGRMNSFAGRDPALSIDDNWPRFLEVWRPIVEYAEEHDVKIGIENCPMFFTGDEWPGGKNLAYSPAVWRRMFEDIPSDHFGLNFDPSHLIWQQIDCVRAIKEFHPKFVHVHAKDERIDTDPTRRDLSVPEMRAFVGGITHPLDRAVVVTLLKAGVRVGELCNLDLRDLRLTDSVASEAYDLGGRPQLSGKPDSLYVSAEPARGAVANGEERSASNKRKRSTVIPVDAELRETLERWLAVRPDAVSPAEPLFVRTAEQWGERLSTKAARRIVTDHAATAGWYQEGGDASENVTPHYFRHFFTTHLRDRTGDRGIVKYLRGDVAGDIIDTYTHNWGDRVRETYESNVYSLF